MPTPDYNRRIIIAREEQRANPSLYSKWGHCLSDVERWWFRENFATDPLVLDEYLSYIVPENGYISLLTVCNNTYGNEYAEMGFVVMVNGLDVISHSTVMEKATGIGSKSESSLVPVSKGDKIHYGTGLKKVLIPPAYRLFFYPVKKYD